MRDDDLELFWNGGELLPPRPERESPCYAERDRAAAVRKKAKNFAPKPPALPRDEAEKRRVYALLLAGRTVRQAAAITKVPRATVHMWAERWSQQGLRVAVAKTGRPRRQGGAGRATGVSGGSVVESTADAPQRAS